MIVTDKRNKLSSSITLFALPNRFAVTAGRSSEARTYSSIVATLRAVSATGPTSVIGNTSCSPMHMYRVKLTYMLVRPTRAFSTFSKRRRHQCLIPRSRHPFLVFFSWLCAKERKEALRFRREQRRRRLSCAPFSAGRIVDRYNTSSVVACSANADEYDAYIYVT